MAASLLVWWSVIEPKKRRLPGDLWKVPYLLGARLAGMFLGMAFIIMRSPAYDQYARTAAEHGWSPLTDQQVAGGMMLGLDLLVMLFATGFFFSVGPGPRPAEDGPPSPLTASAADQGRSRCRGRAACRRRRAGRPRRWRPGGRGGRRALGPDRPVSAVIARRG